MCEYLEYDIRKLKRVRIMNINLDIPIGEYRDFTPKELNQINQSVEHSIKTFEEGK
jgi:23S rRNA pseudouridine2604 synthase